MTQLIDMDILELLGQHVSNPYIRVIISLITAFLSAMGYQSIKEKARVISAKQEQKDVDCAKWKRNDDVKYQAELLFYNLKSDLYAGIMKLISKEREAGHTSMTIECRDETIQGRSLDVVVSKYNQGIKDIRSRAKKRLIHDIDGMIEKGNNKGHKREESVNKVAYNFRKYFFDEIHKLSGNNSKILDMENSVAPYEVFVDMIENLLTETEQANNIMKEEQEKVKSEYRIKTFDVRKIKDTIFHRREK